MDFSYIINLLSHSNKLHNNIIKIEGKEIKIAKEEKEEKEKKQMKLSDILAILQAIVGVEQLLVPIFIHNPKSQSLAGVIMTGEQDIVKLLSGITK